MTEGCETCNNIMNIGGPSKSNTENIDSGISKSIQNPFATVPNSRKDLDRLLNDLAEDPDSESEEVCLEKRVYYRVISGMECESTVLTGWESCINAFITGLHSSISIHICDGYFNQTTGEWVRMQMQREGSNPVLPSIPFNRVVLNRVPISTASFLELGPILNDCTTYTLLTHYSCELSSSSLTTWMNTLSVLAILLRRRKLRYVDLLVLPSNQSTP